MNKKINIEKINKFPANKFKHINFLNLISKDISKRKYKIIVLDDDPTGVQTVHNVPKRIFVKSIDNEKKIGIIIVGSFVKKSTEQLNYLIENSDNIHPILLNIDNLFKNTQSEIEKVINITINSINKNKTPLIYTSRKLKIGKGEAQNIFISRTISDCLASIIKNIKIKPKYIITKGGITSSDIATKALKVKKALVLGQIYPGIPVLKISNPVKFRNLPLIIFPGNVGDKRTLLKIYNDLK